MPDLDTHHSFAASDGRPSVPGPHIAQSVHASPTAIGVAQQHEHRLERLIDRLPSGLRANVRWLRKPSSRSVRIPVGWLLIGGGLLSILPFLGLWMLPLGLMLLAEDVPLLRTWRDRMLDRIERRRPHWLGGTIS